MNRKRILEEQAGRMAVLAAALELDSLFQSCGSDDDARRAAWDDAKGILEDPHHAELVEPDELPKVRELAWKITQVHEALDAKTKRYNQEDADRATYELSNLEESMSGDAIAKTRDAETKVFEGAIEYREALDGLEKKWGKSRFAENEVEARVDELVDDARGEPKPVAWLRKRAELEQATFDVAIGKLELITRLERAAGDLWAEDDLGELFNSLVGE